MQEIEKQEILRVLREGSGALETALRGVDEEIAHCKPAADRWSIVECVEHLVLTEAALLRRLGEAKESVPDPTTTRRAKRNSRIWL